MKYYIENFNYFINISNKNINEKVITYSLNRSFSRKLHMSMIDICNKLNFKLRKCPFCDIDVRPDLYDIELKDNKINIVGCVYTKKFTPCSNKKCRSKILNPNSVEFVSIAYNMSREEALNYIHTRNKSPFYIENHSSLEEYKKYQIRDRYWYKEHGKDMNESIKLGNYHKSLEFYKIKYGDSKGEELYKNINSSKSITLSNMIKKHGEEDGIKVYENWKKQVVQSLDNMIKRYGEENGNIRYKELIKKQISKGRVTNSFENIDSIFIDKEMFFKFLYVRLPIIKQFYIDDYYIEKYIYDENVFIQYIVESLFENKNEFLNQFKKYINNKNIFYDRYKIIKKGILSNIYLTKDGIILRSNLECYFYNELFNNNISDILFYVDKLYPNQNNSRYRYDFYFPDFDEYIEIAGLIENEQYRKRLQIKNKLFSPIILYTQTDIKNYVYNLSIRYNILEESICH